MIILTTTTIIKITILIMITITRPKVIMIPKIMRRMVQKEMTVVVPLDPVTAIAAAVSDLATIASSRRDSIRRAAEVAEIEIKEGRRTLNNVKKKNKNASEWDRNYFGRTSILSKARDVIKVGIPLFF